MAAFAALAAQGSFAVNNHGGQALLKPIRELVAWIDSERVNLELLRQEAKLGTSANAQVMKPYLQKVASDDQGFLTQVLKLRESLLDAEQAILQAMASYEASDEQSARRLGDG